ncbi:MAG: arylsulfatase [Prosthecobacter sp.]|uniref:arylsulfatase n=1 Tax=Prosthecobacter sp. TaxID=1965333 RepID=UPI0025DFFDB8|nr:arylsulfatase [Prosthecobacter sp.]MCF7784840.1 arylsulfatase [Prosthecobacter sp.]
MLFRFIILSHLLLSASFLCAAASPPNIVLILADDLGWSDLGCYGGEIPTPNIDALAQGGLRFTQFYNNAVCGPSRASLLTGLYAQRIGHTGAHWNQPTDFTRSITLGEGLQRAGYHTMMVGKWQDPDLPAKRGFQRFFGPLCAGKISYFNEVRLNPFYLDETRVKLPEDFYLTDALTDHALRFLDDRAAKPATKKQPFFLYVAHIAPHWPLHAREAGIAPHRARYRERGWDQWRDERLKFQRANGLVPAAWKLSPRPGTVHAWADDKFKDWQAERMAVYAAQVASIDLSTGRILDALRVSGELENTLVLFMSDNGAAPDGGVKPATGGFGFTSANKWRLDGHDIQVASGPDHLPGPPDTFAAYGLAWAITSNTPFRSTKLTGYEGGIRTPFIAHWPRGIATPGKIVSDIGHVIDLMPTFLELAGGSYPVEFDGRKPLPLDGRSLVPVLRGESLPPRAPLVWRVPQNRVLRSGDWKIISEDENTPWELYDLARDGTETTNLADQHPDVVKQLAAKWQAWADSCRALK